MNKPAWPHHTKRQLASSKCLYYAVAAVPSSFGDDSHRTLYPKEPQASIHWLYDLTNADNRYRIELAR